MTSNDPATPFTKESTRQILDEVCSLVGLDTTNAEIMRLGENAIFGLATAPIVIRIARSIDSLEDVKKELRVAKWLREADFPAIRLAEISGLSTSTPLVVAQHPVSFWHRERNGDGLPTVTDLGRLLRRLHGLRVPDDLNLPQFDPFARVARRLETAPSTVDPVDVLFLRELFLHLRDEYEALTFPFASCAIHGDAHPGNLLLTDDGTVLLLDFEAFSLGPREWDLSLSAARRYGFDWLSQDSYDDFVQAYGFDVSKWEGFPVLRAIRELTMTTWLMQLVDSEARIRDEFAQRMNDLRTGTMPRHWKAF